MTLVDSSRLLPSLLCWAFLIARGSKGWCRRIGRVVSVEAYEPGLEVMHIPVPAFDWTDYVLVQPQLPERLGNPLQVDLHEEDGQGL